MYRTGSMGILKLRVVKLIKTHGYGSWYACFLFPSLQSISLLPTATLNTKYPNFIKFVLRSGTIGCDNDNLLRHWTFRNEPQWIRNQNPYISIQDNEFKDVVKEWWPFCLDPNVVIHIASVSCFLSSAIINNCQRRVEEEQCQVIALPTSFTNLFHLCIRYQHAAE